MANAERMAKYWLKRICDVCLSLCLRRVICFSSFIRLFSFSLLRSESAILISNAVQLFFSLVFFLLHSFHPASWVQSQPECKQQTAEWKEFYSSMPYHSIELLWIYLFQEIKLNIVRYVYVMLIYALRHWFCHITHREYGNRCAQSSAEYIFHFEILNLFIFSGSFAFSTV